MYSGWQALHSQYRTASATTVAVTVTECQWPTSSSCTILELVTPVASELELASEVELKRLSLSLKALRVPVLRVLYLYVMYSRPA